MKQECVVCHKEYDDATEGGSCAEQPGLPHVPRRNAKMINVAFSWCPVCKIMLRPGDDVTTVDNVKAHVACAFSVLGQEDRGIKQSRAEHDDVNQPSHYAQYDVEPIDAIEAWKLGFCLGNVVKYVARHLKKGTPLKDLKKARWYLDREIANMEKK